MKTYACKNAIKASRNKITVTMVQGKTLATTNKGLNVAHIAQANPISIFNKACPDIIFAKSRILKLKTFAK